MKSKLATCTVMVMTDGTISKYAVMVGPMGKKYFNAHKAKTIATYVMPSTGHRNQIIRTGDDSETCNGGSAAGSMANSA